MNTSTNTAAATVHPFTVRGMGEAPFRFVGMVDQDMAYGEAVLNRAEYERTGVAVTTKAGGTCAYCGTSIKIMYRVVSACGKHSTLGCECIRTVAAELGDSTMARKLALAEKGARQKAAKAKASKVEVELTAALVTHAVALAALPHPTPSRAARGETLLDSLTWLAAHAGATGKAKALKTIKTSL